MYINSKFQTLFTPKEAERLAESLDSDPEDTWIYVAIPDPQQKDLAKIVIIDKNHIFLGYL